jgi:NodT family efflux transporter outer membrane factor (OMF) lipoprotein
MRPAQFAAVSVCLALSACATPRKADVALPQAFEAPAPSAAAAVDLDRWWTAFGDEQLTALIETALVSAPDARSAAARLTEARASAAAALTSFLPQGDATGSARRTETEQTEGQAVSIPGFSSVGRSDAYASNFNVSWEVDLFGRFFTARRGAAGDSAAARFAYEGARSSLAAAIADAYFQARGLAVQLEDARETARIQASLYDAAQVRAERGLAASSEPDRVAGDLAQARAQVESLDAELKAAKRDLLVLSGRGVDPLASLPTPAEVGAIPDVPASLPGQLLARRPDVREAQARVDSAAGRLTYAQLAFLPTLKFTPGLGLSRSVQPGYESTTENWSIGGAVSVPVLDIPKLLYDLKAQNARTEQAVIAYEKAVQTAYGEADNALLRLEADRRRVVLLKDGEVRAARAYEASRLGYARGLSDLQTALGAEQSWRATRSQYAAAQVQGLRRAVQTYKALGGGWPSDDAAKPNEAR